MKSTISALLAHQMRPKKQVITPELIFRRR